MRPEAFKCGIMVVILLYLIIYNNSNVLHVKVGPRCHFRDARMDGKMSNHVIGSIASATTGGIFQNTFAPSLKAGKSPSLVPNLFGSCDSSFWNWEALGSDRSTHPNGTDRHLPSTKRSP